MCTRKPRRESPNWRAPSSADGTFVDYTMGLSCHAIPVGSNWRQVVVVDYEVYRRIGSGERWWFTVFVALPCTKRTNAFFFLWLGPYLLSLVGGFSEWGLTAVLIGFAERSGCGSTVITAV